MLHKTLVKPVLMYESETWKMNKSDDQKVDVDVFHSRCLRRILKISWQERVTNEEVLQMSGVRNLSDYVRRRRWQFIGHIMRKEPDNDCRTALTWTPEGRRKRGRPKTTRRRSVEKERGRGGWRSWNTAAADKEGWRQDIKALCATLHQGER